MSRLIQCGGLLFLVFLLTACTSLPIKPITPKISLADFRLLNLGLLEQNYRLRLRLNNPNPFPLPLTQFNYQVRINEQEFTQGKSNQAITIPALGEEFLDVNVTSNLLRLIGQWQDWKTLLNQQFRYQLVGSVNVVDWAPQLPFDYQGEVALFWGGNPTDEQK
jgi:LEA14-like dessication related protein